MFFFSSRRRHTRFDCDWSSDVCSSDLAIARDMEGKTICVFADAAAWPVQSYITKFREEFEEHIRTGTCASDRGKGQGARGNHSLPLTPHPLALEGRL